MNTNSIITYPDNSADVFASHFDNRWIEIFQPMEAIERVFQHVETLPSSRTTRHTARQYRICLYDYLKFCGAVIDEDQTDKTRLDGDTFNFDGMGIHTERQMRNYLSYCLAEKRSSKTIKKYLAPIGIYLEGLIKKSFFGIRGETRDIIFDAKQLFEMARDIKAPKEETKSRKSAGQKGIRLSLTQTREYLDNIERDTKKGKRDVALFYVALITGLRVSELARIRLCDIRVGQSNTPYEIAVLRKRNNVDPVGLDVAGYQLIQDYVDFYNEGLADDDARRITETSALWQPLLHADHYATVGVNYYCPERGLSEGAIRDMMKARTPTVVREQIGHRGICPHDVRRTMALGLADSGVKIHVISMQMGHSNADVTAGYIGKPEDLSAALLSNYWTGLLSA